MNKRAMKKLKKAAKYIESCCKKMVTKKELKRIYKQLPHNNKNVAGVVYAYVGV